MTNSTTQTSRSLLALGGLLMAFGTGCMQKPLCSELGECGGAVPLGSWALSPGHPSCSEDLYVPPTDPRLLGGEVASARSPVIEPAFFDWCNLLVTNNGTSIQAKAPRFFYESGPIGWANINYKPDGHYTLGVSRTGTYSLDFPELCMRQFGAVDGKPAVDANGNEVTGPTNVCKQLEVPLRASGIGEGSYPNTTCEINPADPGGCICFFDVTETGGGSGTYRLLDNHTIMHLPGSNFPQKVTFCNKGGSLQLTGADGEYLFGQKGLRTMDLSSVVDPCTNGQQDGMETGVDCGGTCAAACPM